MARSGSSASSSTNASQASFSPTASGSDPINARRRVVEELGLLRRRIAARDLLEGVPQHLVAGRDLLDGEVRFEHRPVGAELLDDELEIGSCGLGKLVARWWRRPFVPGEAVDLHEDAAELDRDVGAGGELGDVALPDLADLLALALIGGAAAGRAADMVEDDGAV